MKVPIVVNLVIKVDPEDWDISFGTGTKISEVRKDVKDYILNSVLELSGITESGAEVTIR